MIDPSRNTIERPLVRCRCNGIALLVAALVLAGAPAPTRAEEAALVRGDAAWARRAADRDGMQAAPDAIDDAIAAYRVAWDEGAGSLASGWMLVRALWWAREFAALDEPAATSRFAEARAVATKAFSGLDARSRGGTAVSALAPEDWPDAFSPERHEDVAGLLLWSAIAEGSWARSQGLLANIRQGVAGLSHDRARASVALAPGIDEGGAQRLLSRLHAELPRVPLVTGWVDRDLALEWAERITPTSGARGPLPSADRREAQQPAALAVFEYPDRAVRPLLDLADARAHVEPLRLARSIAVEDDPQQHLARQTAHEPVAVPVREQGAGIDHEAGRRDGGLPPDFRSRALGPRVMIRNPASGDRASR